MRDIKTKETKKDIKSLDKAGNLAKAVRNTAVRTKDQIENLSDDGQISPSEYAEDKVKYMAESATEDAGKLAKKSAKKTYEGGKKIYRNIRQRRQTKETVEEATKATTQTTKTINRTIKTQRQTVKTAQEVSRTTIKTAKQTAKTVEQTAKAAEKAAKASAKASKVAAQTAREAAAAAYKGAVALAKATVAAVKAIAAGISKLVAAIAAGGWVAVVVILVICLVALVVGSCFGIFFSGDDSGTGMTMQTAITEINNEYQNKITEIKNGRFYDVLEMSGSRAVWPEVLAIYAVKTTTDPNNPQEVASMDSGKLQILKDVFWDMNVISYSTKSKTEYVITENDDGNGNIVETRENKTRTYLYITVAHKTANEMANQYGFNYSQREQLSELLSDENQKLWSQVLYGFTTGNEQIVAVAIAQIGNIGGYPYWSWYGFGSRVEWCACFVSWCANECGYVQIGVIPKYAGCVNGVQWFKDRGLWQDNTYTPNPGDIIFFDWNNKGSSGPQDGEADHTGIVERVENGIVYTVEGNSGDACKERQYTVGYYEILGYGTPQY